MDQTAWNEAVDSWMQYTFKWMTDVDSGRTALVAPPEPPRLSNFYGGAI